MSQPQALSSKEQSLFKTVVKNYESKQYKKGLKSAEQILKKNPNNGDTQAMKALIINSMGQTDEAFALVKVALKNGMKSHTCWHVYGLLWRSQRNVEEAIKAYSVALKLDRENPTILRDLALMQVQTRDYHGYIESRRRMLQARPALRQNWTAVAIAHHLAGDLDAAERTLKTYEDTLKNPPSRSDQEHSEAALYKNTIIAESGDTTRALEHLESISDNSGDRTATMEMRADYLLRLNRMEEAEKAYRALIDRNSEYRAYYEGLEKAMQIPRTDKQARKELYGSYAQNHDRLDAARRIPLDFLDGDDFKGAADHYLQRMLRKGVPSTFNNVKSLYVDPSKSQIIQDLVEGYRSGIHTDGTSETNGDKPDRFPEAVLYFLAQHYNFRLTRDLEKAMQFTNELIGMAPKTYDYLMTKARIIKHKGNPTLASQTMNAARELDLRDRYINTKCAKYQLRNHDDSTALKTMSAFTKNETVGGTLGDLLDMQSLWFITEKGESCSRQSQFGRALKYFTAVFDIFTTWEDDQFDFHAFSLRKGQIRAYIEMMRWEDRLREHPFYSRAAIAAIKVYLLLHDQPELAQGDGLPYDFTSLNDAGKKAALKKAEAERKRVVKEAEDQREADRKVVGKKGNLGVDGEVKKSDVDPQGAKFTATKTPLEDALKFLNPLMEHGRANLEAQVVGFEVYLRRQKYHLALRCLLASLSLSPSPSTATPPTPHQQSLRLLHALTTHPPSDPAVAKSLSDLISTSLPAPYNTPTPTTASLLKINDTYLSQNTGSAPHTFAHAIARSALDPSSKAESAESAEEVAGCLRSCKDVALEDAVQGVEVLKRMGASRMVVGAYVEEAAGKWPDARVLLERGRGWVE